MQCVHVVSLVATVDEDKGQILSDNLNRDPGPASSYFDVVDV
jgi:hypothetical protein